MPLAMAALPLYVHLPKFYGDHLGVSLAALGVLLLVLRLVDGVARSAARRVERPRAVAQAPDRARGAGARRSAWSRCSRRRRAAKRALLAWLGGALALVYVAFSLATINHGAWGAELSPDPVERTRITAVREALALVGVVIASVAPSLLGGSGGESTGLPRFALAFAVFGARPARGVTLAYAPAGTRIVAPRAPLFAAWRRRSPNVDFRRLLAVFIANGIASADPGDAGALLHRRRAAARKAQQGLFLALYFIAGAAGMPLWVQALGAVRQGARVARGDARGDRRLRVGGAARAAATR